MELQCYGRVRGQLLTGYLGPFEVFLELIYLPFQQLLWSQAGYDWSTVHVDEPVPVPLVLSCAHELGALGFDSWAQMNYAGIV